MIANHGAPILGTGYKIFYVHENLGYLESQYGSIDQAIKMLETDPEALVAWLHAGLRYMRPDMPVEDARAIVKTYGADTAINAIAMAFEAYRQANIIPKPISKIKN